MEMPPYSMYGEKGLGYGWPNNPGKSTASSITRFASHKRRITPLPTRLMSWILPHYASAPRLTITPRVAIRVSFRPAFAQQNPPALAPGPTLILAQPGTRGLTASTRESAWNLREVPHL